MVFIPPMDQTNVKRGINLYMQCHQGGFKMKKLFLYVLQSLLIGITIILTFTFRVKIERQVTLFMMPLIYLACFVLGLISIIASVICLVRGIKNNGYSFALTLPLIINVVICLVSIFNPFEKYVIHFELKEKIYCYNEICNDIMTKKLSVNEKGVVYLTGNYGDISINNTVVIFKQNDKYIIYFQTENGFLDTSSGFGFITTQEIDNYSYCTEVREIYNYTGDWMYCSVIE